MPGDGNSPERLPPSTTKFGSKAVSSSPKGENSSSPVDEEKAAGETIAEKPQATSQFRNELGDAYRDRLEQANMRWHQLALAQQERIEKLEQEMKEDVMNGRNLAKLDALPNRWPTCPFCNASFGTKSRLREHLRKKLDKAHKSMKRTLETYIIGSLSDVKPLIKKLLKRAKYIKPQQHHQEQRFSDLFEQFEVDDPHRNSNCSFSQHPEGGVQSAKLEATGTDWLDEFPITADALLKSPEQLFLTDNEDTATICTDPINAQSLAPLGDCGEQAFGYQARQPIISPDLYGGSNMIFEVCGPHTFDSTTDTQYSDPYICAPGVKCARAEQSHLSDANALQQDYRHAKSGFMPCSYY